MSGWKAATFVLVLAGSIALAVLVSPYWIAFLAVVFVVAALTRTRGTSQIDDWERHKAEAWDRQEHQARARSSTELHEELDRIGRERAKS
jgi:fatty acid desaturase